MEFEFNSKANIAICICCFSPGLTKGVYSTDYSFIGKYVGGGLAGALTLYITVQFYCYYYRKSKRQKTVGVTRQDGFPKTRIFPIRRPQVRLVPPPASTVGPYRQGDGNSAAGDLSLATQATRRGHATCSDSHRLRVTSHTPQPEDDLYNSISDFPSCSSPQGAFSPARGLPPAYENPVFLHGCGIVYPGDAPPSYDSLFGIARGAIAEGTADQNALNNIVMSMNRSRSMDIHSIQHGLEDKAKQPAGVEGDGATDGTAGGSNE